MNADRDKFKLLVIIPYYKPAYIYGGPTRSISAACESLAQDHGVSVTVLTTNANGSDRLDVPLNTPLDVNGVTVTYYPLPPFALGSFFFAPALIRAAAARIADFDLVELHAMWTALARPLQRACQQTAVPYVVSLRSQLLPWALAHGRLKKQIYWRLIGKDYLNNAAALHCTIPLEEAIVPTLGLSTPTFIVPNGIDLRDYEDMPERGTLRQQLGIGKTASVLLFMGRLHKKKRPDIAVATLAGLHARGLDVHLLVAGPDEQQLGVLLREQAHNAGCEDRLHLLGLLQGDALRQALVDSDLMLMPSMPESENFGMSALESLASGTAVVVSDGVPIGPLIEEAGAGRMVDCKAEAFIRAAGEVLQSPHLLDAMARKGPELARTHFDRRVVARQLYEHYLTLVSESTLTRAT